MMKKLALGAAGLAVAVVLGGPLLLKTLLPPEKVRTLIQDGARKSLHREVKLGGASLSVIHGLTLEDLSLSEAPDFSAGTFVSVKSFSLRARLLPLLRKKVVIGAVSADGLVVHVVKKKDGTYNFSSLSKGSAPSGAAPAPASDAAPASSPAPAPAAKGSSELEVAIRNLSLGGASVVYEEEGAPRKVELKSVSAQVSGFSLKGPFSAQLAGKASGQWDERKIDGSASFSGKVDLGGQDPRLLSVDAKTLELTEAGWTLKLSGSAKDLSAPALDLTFKVSGPPGNVASGAFKGAVTPATEKTALAASGTLTLKTSALKPQDAAAASFGSLPEGMPVPQLSASADFAYGDEALALKRLEAQTPWGPLKASGKIAGFGAPKLAVDVQAEGDLNLPAVSEKDAPWLKLPTGAAIPPLKVAGKAHVTGDSLTTPGLTIKGAFGFLEMTGSVRRPAKAGAHPDEDLSLSLKVDVPALKGWQLAFAGLPPEVSVPPMSLVGQGRLKGDDLFLTPLKVKGAAGTLEASGSVRGLTSGAPEPNLDLTMDLSLPALKSADDPFGKAPPGLALPASTWNGSLTASRDEVKIRSLHAVIGRNDFSVEGGRLTGLRGAAPFVNLVIKCKQFQLEDLTALSTPLKELDLKGGGYFALSATGRLPRPVLEGKAQFKGVGAVVQGLDLSGFTGTASFNETRIDVPNLRGSVAGGDLALNLTLKNYAKAPDIELEASLDTFDLGKYLAAKQALEAKHAEKVAAKAEKAAAAAAQAGAPAAGGAPAQAAAPTPPISTRGKFTVGKLLHPNLQAADIRLDWDITGLTPELRQLNGGAKVASPSGRFTNLQSMGKQSKILKIVTLPLALLQKIALGALQLDLNNPQYSDFAGDYAFENGVMHVRDSRLNAEGRPIDIKGDVDLPKENLDLTVTAEIIARAPVDVAVTGTLESPKTKIKVARAVGEQLKNGAEQLLRGFLKSH